jgi:DNA glycosylase AlkZ-like
VSLAVSPQQAVAYRLRVNNLLTRVPAGDYARAARYALQDSGPRDGLSSLHARVTACEPSAWEAPGLAQVYSPRAAVHIVPVDDFGVFTRGRLPFDPDRRRAIERAADDICRILDGREVRQADLPGLEREASASGRIALRWTTSALYIREITAPELDLDEARIELCRRHLHAFGPSTAAAFAWWSGLSPADAGRTWKLLPDPLVAVTVGTTPAWLRAADEEALRSAPPATGVRFLPAGDLRIFGQDRTGTLVGPGQWHKPPATDTFHPHGLVHDGQVIGAWGRRGGRLHVRIPEPLTADVLAAAEEEAGAMPIPGYPTTLEVSVG